MSRACGNVEIVGDFQGGWEEWESWFWISTLSTHRHFHRPPVSSVTGEAVGDETGAGTHPPSRSPAGRIKPISSDRRPPAAQRLDDQKFRGGSCPRLKLPDRLFGRPFAPRVGVV